MKLILFDIDGTLITGGSGRISLGVAFREVFGLSAGQAEAAMKVVTFNGRTDPAIIRDVAAAAGVKADDIDNSIPALLETYLRHLDRLTDLSAPRICPGVPELLDALEFRHGFMTGLLTGNIEAGARIKLRPTTLNRHFPTGGFGSDSPDRNVIAAMARKKFEVLLGHPIAADRVLVVGDTVHDVTCGQANGFRTLAVGTGGVPLDRLAEAGPDILLKDMGDVPAVMAAIEETLAPAGAARG